MNMFKLYILDTCVHKNTHTHTLVKKRVPVDKSYSAGSLWKPGQIKCTYTCGNVLLMEPILTIASSAHRAHAAEKTHTLRLKALPPEKVS